MNWIGWIGALVFLVGVFSGIYRTLSNIEYLAEREREREAAEDRRTEVIRRVTANQ